MPDGKRAILVNEWDPPKVWDLETGQCLSTLMVGHRLRVVAVALLPDGKRAVSGSWDKTLKLWDLETGLCLATWQAASPVECLAAGPEFILASTAAGVDDELGVAYGAGEVLFLKVMPRGRIVPQNTIATWHPSLPLLAVARANNTLLVQAWRPGSQYLEELARTSLASPIDRLQWSRDSQRLLCVTRENTEHILDATTLQPASASGDWAPSSFTSPDGRWRAQIRDGQLEVVPVSSAASP